MQNPVVWITLLVLMNFLWAASSTVVKWGLGSFDPLVLVFWRFALAFVALASFAVIRRHSFRMSFGTLLRICLAGVLSSGSNLLWVIGTDMSHATDASLLYTFEPIWGILLAGLVLKERIHLTTIAGFFLVIMGLGSLSNFNLASFGLGTNSVTLGNLLIVAGLFCEGSLSVALKPLSGRLSAPVVMAGVTAVNVLLLSVPMTLRGGFEIEFSSPFLICVAYLAVVCTALGYTLWVSVMRHVPVGIMLFTTFIQPVFGPFIAAAFIGEKIDSRVIAGGALLLSGMLVSVLGYLSSKKSEAAKKNIEIGAVAGNI